MKKDKDPDYTEGNRRLFNVYTPHDRKSRKKGESSGRSKNRPDADIFTGAITAREKHTRSFPDLKLNPDMKNRPLYVCPDGHIFLETFSDFYKPAYDFLISIAEPVSRPKFIHEYQITLYSIFAAVSIGLTAEEIIRVLSNLSKCELADELKKNIKKTISAVGKLKLILKNNRYFVESADLGLLQRIAHDEVISQYRIPDRNPADTYDEGTGFILVDEEDSSTMIAGIGESSIYSSTSRMMNELGVGEIETPAKPIVIRRFEVNGRRIRKVRERALQLNLPFTDEYDFRADTRNSDIKELDLKQGSAIRPYQEKALSKMFGGGRAKSGIIVLPCGAGKTLVGITATCTVRKNTIVFCNGAVPVQQWYDQFQLWTTVNPKDVIMLTSKHKQELPETPCILITTYTMVSHSGHRSEETERIMEQIAKREWGLMVIDEVQEMPARTFSQIIEKAHAHCKLGLTATLVREDEKISNLNYLIGPKLYEANWIDLSEQGFIARVRCYEIWCKMTGEFYKDMLRTNEIGRRRLLSAMNPNKFMTVERLIKYHERRGDKILVFADILWVLEKYSAILKKPFLCGRTSDDERNKIFQMFRNTNKCNCLFISKIGDKAIDLPSANVLIQICSHFGSRMQEAQRLGRILRPKSGRTDEYNAFFYTLVSEDTKEMYFSSKRQQFLVDQGYSFEVIKDAEKRWPAPGPLHYETVGDQRELLRECDEANDTAGAVETIDDEDRDPYIERRGAQ